MRQTCRSLIGSLLAVLLTAATAAAEPRPSLFRGVVVADSPLGVRIVSVEDASQAALVDLRPEDVLVQVDDTPVTSIDQFGVLSLALKGQAVTATLVVLRNGQPRQIALHLYSMPILRQWELAFIPQHDIRFAEPKTGVAYWERLGRGFEEAGNTEGALDAYLNALHNDPSRTPSALNATLLSWRLARQRLEARRLAEAITAIQQGTVLLEKLFNGPLTGEQLQAIQTELQQTTRALAGARIDVVTKDRKE